MSVPYIDIKVHGLDHLAKELKQIPEIMRRRVLSRGVAAGASLARKYGREQAKAEGLKGETGKLIRSMRYKRKRSKSRDIVLYGIGYSGSGWYGRLYEYGFKNPVGERRQRPVLRKVLDERTDEIWWAIKDRTLEEIAKVKTGGIVRAKRR